ncbi:MAG TPA: hypothetical protein VII95_14540 [Terriglobales bacterium]
MRRSVSVIAVLFLLFPLAILAQHGGRHGGSTGTSGGTNAPAQDPDMATFKHAMAVQASQQQIAQFALMDQKHGSRAAAGARSSTPGFGRERFTRPNRQGDWLTEFR